MDLHSIKCMNQNRTHCKTKGVNSPPPTKQEAASFIPVNQNLRD